MLCYVQLILFSFLKLLVPIRIMFRVVHKVNGISIVIFMLITLI